MWSRISFRGRIRPGVGLAALTLAVAAVVFANPADFGMTEFQAAVSARNLKLKLATEFNLDAPETFRIEPFASGGARVTGGDLRGLMYGLLAAADQVRDTGKLKAYRGEPSIPYRGVRITISDPKAAWIKSDVYWRPLFQKMARQWMNRLALEWEPGVTTNDFADIATVSRLAAEYGVEVTLASSRLEGSPDQIHDLYEKLLHLCPLIRGLEFEGSQLDLPGYGEALLQPLVEAGRLVSLEIRDGAAHPMAAQLAQSQGLDVRLTARLACNVPQPSPLCLARAAASNPRSHDSVWEIAPESWIADEGAVKSFLPVLDSGFDLAAAPPSASDGPVLKESFLALWGRSTYVINKPLQ